MLWTSSRSILVILAGRKAALCTSHSSRAGAAASWRSLCSHHAHELCSWSHAPMAPWRTALTHLGAPRSKISVEAPPRQDTRTHDSQSRQREALRNCPVFWRAVNPPGSTVRVGWNLQRDPKYLLYVQAHRSPGTLLPRYLSPAGVPWLSPKVAHFLRWAGTWSEIHFFGAESPMPGATTSSPRVAHLWQSPRTFDPSDGDSTLS